MLVGLLCLMLHDGEVRLCLVVFAMFGLFVLRLTWWPDLMFLFCSVGYCCLRWFGLVIVFVCV